jgi:hypothetical protein
MVLGTFVSLVPAKPRHPAEEEGKSHSRVLDCDESRIKSVSLYRMYKMYRIDFAAVAVGAYTDSSSGGSLSVLERGDARLALPAAESQRRPALRINHLTAAPPDAQALPDHRLDSAWRASGERKASRRVTDARQHSGAT